MSEWQDAFKETLKTSIQGGSLGYKAAFSDLALVAHEANAIVEELTNGKVSVVVRDEYYNSDGAFVKICVLDKATKEEHFAEYFSVGWAGYPIHSSQSSIHNLEALRWCFTNMAKIGTPFYKAIRCAATKNGVEQ